MLQTKGLSGPGNSNTHQKLIAELLYAFMKKIKNVDAYSIFDVLPEIVLENKVPDIVVYKVSKRNGYSPVAIFEVCYKAGLNNDITKCSNLMTQNKSITEAFIIDITNEIVVHKLYRLKNGNISKPTKNSKFDTFKLDLNDIIKLIS